jgi:hypothetical protein
MVDTSKPGFVAALLAMTLSVVIPGRLEEASPESGGEGKEPTQANVEIPGSSLRDAPE